MTITPGLRRDLSNNDYHALTDWHSSTQLKMALPEIYSDTTEWSAPALAFGTMVHTMVLEPDNLDNYAVLDAVKVGVKADGTVADNPTATKAWKMAVAEAEASGKIVTSQEDWDKARRMTDAVRAHPEANELLFQGEGDYEISAFARDENGLQHKARFDRLIPGEGVDLKTTSSKPGATSLTRSVVDFGYDVSAYHYTAVADLLNLDLESFALVFVDKSAHHRVTVARFDQHFMERGRILRDRALERLNDPTLDRYEGQSEPLTLTCPGWARLGHIDEPANIPTDFTWSLNEYA